MLAKIVRDALILVTTVDPIGTLALFAALTGGLDDGRRRRIATRAILYAGAILLAAVLVGQLLLQGLGIRLISLQLAGGAILFLFAVQMIFSKDAGTPSGEAPEEGHDLAVFPMAVPSIAGPGAIMAVILLTDNDLYNLPQQAATAGVLVAVLAGTWALMLLSGRVLRVIGRNGSAILVRVMGMLLAALSVELVMNALGVGGWAAEAPR